MSKNHVDFYSQTDPNQTLQPNFFPSLFSMDKWLGWKVGLKKLGQGTGGGGDRRGEGGLGAGRGQQYYHSHSLTKSLAPSAIRLQSVAADAVAVKWPGSVAADLTAGTLSTAFVHIWTQSTWLIYSLKWGMLFQLFSDKEHFMSSWTQCKDTTKNKRGTLQE